MKLFVDHDTKAAVLDVGGKKLVLEPGEWSDFVTVTFDMLPSWVAVPVVRSTASVRFYLRSIEPEVELYASPVNIDPSAPVAPGFRAEQRERRTRRSLGGRRRQLLHAGQCPRMSTRQEGSDHHARVHAASQARAGRG